MATKRFKALPKDSQRAAFAEMDKDGSRRGRDASNANRVRSNLSAATSKAARELKDIKPAKEHLDWAKNWQKAQESRIGQEMKGTIYHDDLKRKISDAKKEAKRCFSCKKGDERIYAGKCNQTVT